MDLLVDGVKQLGPNRTPVPSSYLIAAALLVLVVGIGGVFYFRARSTDTNNTNTATNNRGPATNNPGATDNVTTTDDTISDPSQTDPAAAQSYGKDLDKIILHSTESPTDELAVKYYDLPEDIRKGHTTHYLVLRSGEIRKFQEDSKPANHIPPSASFKGKANLNNSSISVDLSHKHGEGYPQEQITALVDLLSDLVHKHDLETDSSLSHAEIEPDKNKAELYGLDISDIKRRVNNKIKNR